MSYKIKVNYNTGDSFHLEEGREHILELSWESLDNAKANLKRINEHYKLYRELNTYTSEKTIKDVISKYNNEDWYVDYNTNLIKFYSDDGDVWQIWPTWIGHFESLNYAEIIVEDNDLKISF